MRYRVTDYTIEGQTIILQSEVTIEDIRLIVNETQKKVICSSMQKNNVGVTTSDGYSYITVNEEVCLLESNDQLTIELDLGGDAYTMLDQLLAIQLQTIIGE